MNKKVWLTGLALTAIMILAIGYRFYDIQNYPPGLFPDQAANGEDVFLIFDGDARPFYPRGNGREALFFYIQAVFVKMFGVAVWPMFAASATVGVLTVLATYFATRVYFGRLSGLLASFFLATSFWHVTLSRTGFRAIMIPLFVALFTAFVGYAIKAVKDNKIKASYIYSALAGASFMGGFYTYIAYRVMIGVVLGIFLLLLLAAIHPKIGFPHFKRYWRQSVIGLVAGFIVFLPLLLFFIAEPESFIGRAGQVSIFSVDLQREYGGGTLLGTLMYSTRETLLSFFVGEGDTNWRHSVAGFPLLNPLVGILFLLGFAWTIHGTVTVALNIFKGKEIHLGMIYPYILLLLFGMLLPVVTTAEGMPHGLRSIGLIAPIFLLAGTAGSVTLYWMKRNIKVEQLRATLFGLAFGALVLSALYDGVLYFGISRNDAEAHYEYRGDLTVVADYINNYKESPRPYLVLDAFSVQTVHFLASVSAHDYQNHPDEHYHKYGLLNPADSHKQLLNPGEVIIFTQSTIFDAERYFEIHGEALELVESKRNRFGQEVMRVYTLRSDFELQDQNEEETLAE